MKKTEINRLMKIYIERVTKMSKSEAINVILALPNKKLKLEEKIVAIKLVNNKPDDYNFTKYLEIVTKLDTLTEEAHRAFFWKTFKHRIEEIQNKVFKEDDFDGRGKYCLVRLSTIKPHESTLYKYDYSIELNGIEYEPTFKNKPTSWIFKNEEVEVLIKLNMIVAKKGNLYYKRYKGYKFNRINMTLDRIEEKYDKSSLN